MTMPILMEEITLSEMLRQVQTKLLENHLLEEAMELNERDLAIIIARSEVQRKMMRIRAAEMKSVVERLQAFADSNPIMH